MSDDALPEADRAPGAPHPRDTTRLIGQPEAEAAFLRAHTDGRLHHAWLITGPRGVGKATLAWRLARFLLATPAPDDGGLFGAPEPPATLDIPADHPVCARVRAGSEPGLFLLRRPWDDDRKRLKAEITVDEVRRLKNFFSLSAAEGGRRVAIIDAADEMNTSAANALLKVLEEPPRDVVMLLISHQPARLLPTIRSRCRTLRCTALEPAAMAEALAQAGAETPDAGDALAALAGGSVGAAMRLLAGDGPKNYARIVQTVGSGDRGEGLALADSVAGPGKAEALELLIELFETFLSRLARTGASGHPPAPEAAPGEADLLARLSPDPHAARTWAALGQELSARARHGRAVNIDPSALILDMVLKIREKARETA